MLTLTLSLASIAIFQSASVWPPSGTEVPDNGFGVLTLWADPHTATFELVRVRDLGSEQVPLELLDPGTCTFQCAFRFPIGAAEGTTVTLSATVDGGAPVTVVYTAGPRDGDAPVFSAPPAVVAQPDAPGVWQVTSSVDEPALLVPDLIAAGVLVDGAVVDVHTPDVEGTAPGTVFLVSGDEARAPCAALRAWDQGGHVVTSPSSCGDTGEGEGEGGNDNDDALDPEVSAPGGCSAGGAATSWAPAALVAALWAARRRRLCSRC